jgi:predicted acylesterase/phospholipase RssA
VTEGPVDPAPGRHTSGPADLATASAVDDRLREAARLLFGDETVAASISRIATIAEVPAGITVFRQGSPGDSAYLVLTGRLRVVRHEDGRDEDLADVVRGEIVGELALLTGEQRSATVYAVRDSVIARIGAEAFEILLREQPGAALPIMRFLANRLRRFTVERGAGPGGEATIAVFALGSADAGEFARQLAEAIGSHTPVELLFPGDPDAPDLSAAFERAEAAGRVLVCPGEPGWTSWNAALLRHAHEVLLLADGGADPAPGPVDAAVFAPREWRGPRVTLVLRHAKSRSPSGTQRWLTPRAGVEHLHIRAGDAADAARVGRWVTGRSIGLVLGGGGARGWAHLGALRAIEELGIPVDLVGGTSQGALVGASVADRRTAAAIRDEALPLVAHLRDYTVPFVSLLRGRLIGRTLEHLVRPGISIEDLWLPYFAVATNLSRAERMVQARGDVVGAVRASISLPVLLPPVVRDGELLIDGGLLDNVPVDEMRRRVGTGAIIAIDVSSQSAAAPYEALEPDVSGFRLLLDRVLPFRRRRGRVPSIGEVAMMTVMAGSRHLRNRSADDPGTLRLQPQLGEWGLMGFQHLDEIAEIGYREMREPLAAWWAARTAGEDASSRGPEVVAERAAAAAAR